MLYPQRSRWVSLQGVFSWRGLSIWGDLTQSDCFLFETLYLANYLRFTSSNFHRTSFVRFKFFSFQRGVFHPNTGFLP